MADEKDPKDAGQSNDDQQDPASGDPGSENDFGNLPPLSDFESSEEGSGGISGLPPIGDISVETPMPTGGNVRPAPVGSGGDKKGDTSDFAFDTPSSVPGSGFQDLGADSDFTPETPAAGPGESDFETPMFDSAFGEGDNLFGDSPQSTSAPTQAMDTPMFGSPSDTGASGAGFDQDAFGGTGGSAFDGGTPVPDFNPDTAAPGMATPPPMQTPPPPVVTRGGGGGGMSVILTALVVGLVFLIIGMLIGPLVSHRAQVFPGALNPWSTELAEAEDRVQTLQSEKNNLQRQLDEVTQMSGGEGMVDISQEEIDRLIAQRRELDSQLASLQQLVSTNQQELSAIQAEVTAKNEEYVQAEQAYEELLNQTNITSARRDGLMAESERLQSLVGSLQEADQRRVMSKNELAHASERLSVQIADAMPLTPPEFAHADRLERANALRTRIANTNWVDPDLLREYNEIAMNEMDIAQKRAYFFAKVPVIDDFGNRRELWAECLMNGNWSVYYRTIDGRFVGVYEDLGSAGLANFGFRQELDKPEAQKISSAITAHRTPNWENKIEVLREKQRVTDNRTPMQRVYDSM